MTTQTLETEFDNSQAEREGWAIFSCDGAARAEPYQLQKDDEAGVFETDDSAWSHVISMARNGSEYHRAALAWLRINSPVEFDSIAKFAKTIGAPI